MSTKNCIKVVGSGSDDGFKFRSSQHLQRACLRGEFGCLDKEGTNLTTICKDWLGCFESEERKTQKEALELFFNVSSKQTGCGGGGAALLIGGNTSVNAGDAAGCFDPSVADPEELECNCHEEAMKTCEETMNRPEEKMSESDKEECLKRFMCGHDKLCKSWKDANCPSHGSSALEAGHTVEGSLSARAARFQRYSTEEKEDRLAAMDESLSGKRCRR